MWKTSIVLALGALLVTSACQALPAAPAFATPLALDNLDLAAFSEWVDGQERPVTLRDGPRHVIWTQSSAPEWDGLRFSDSKTSGARHLRIGWKAALPVGTILARAGGQVSVLKAAAAYPGNMADETQWLPAIRLRGAAVTRDEAGQEDYCLWTLPPGTSTLSNIGVIFPRRVSAPTISPVSVHSIIVSPTDASGAWYRLTSAWGGRPGRRTPSAGTPKSTSTPSPSPGPMRTTIAPRARAALVSMASCGLAPSTVPSSSTSPACRSSGFFSHPAFIMPPAR